MIFQAHFEENISFPSLSAFSLQLQVGVVLCLEVCRLLIVHPQSLKRQENVAKAPLGLSRRKENRSKPIVDIYEKAVEKERHVEKEVLCKTITAESKTSVTCPICSLTNSHMCLCICVCMTGRMSDLSGM